MATTIITEEVAEFGDAPYPGSSLFVKSSWLSELPLRELPPIAESVICQLLACDSEHCWQGQLRRCDLAGPLEQSWSKPANLQLMCEALTGTLSAKPTTSSSQADARGVPSAQAVWTVCHDSSLELAIRFLFRAGPIIAIKGVRLPRIELGGGLCHFFSLAHGGQVEARTSKEVADEECSSLQRRRDTLQRQLDALPLQLEAEEKRLLDEFVAILNCQKRRCRQLWDERRARSGLCPPPVDLPFTSPTQPSLEACLDRRDDMRGPATKPPNPDVTPHSHLSLAFVSPVRQDASTFTIPLTLGMGDGDATPFACRASASHQPLPAVKAAAPSVAATGSQSAKRERTDAHPGDNRPLRCKTEIP